MDNPNQIWEFSAPAWLSDADELEELAAVAIHYFDTADDPVVGLISNELGFRVVHRLGAETFYNSGAQYRPTTQGPEGKVEWGDIVNLGRSRNMQDGQIGTLLARILAPAETPAEYAHYMIHKHTYTILVE